MANAGSVGVAGKGALELFDCAGGERDDWDESDDESIISDDDCQRVFVLLLIILSKKISSNCVSFFLFLFNVNKSHRLQTKLNETISITNDQLGRQYEKHNRQLMNWILHRLFPDYYVH